VRADYAVLTYRLRRLSWQVLLASPDRRGLRLAERTWVSGGSWLRRLFAIAGGLNASRRAVTIASRGSVVPAALAASGLTPASNTAWCLAVDEEDRRRRAVLLVPDVRMAAQAVIKLGRSPVEDDRFTLEQTVLTGLPGGRTPRPLGNGLGAPGGWSAETVVQGRPLHRLARAEPAAVRPALASLTTWLAEVGVRTSHPVDWGGLAASGIDEVIPLRGRAAGLSHLLTRLSQVPAVLVHGDLASGYNVLVDGAGRPGVIDWETARGNGLPLLDLLPLLCVWSTGSVRAQAPEEQAARISAMAHGRSEDGAWLHAQISTYAARVGLPSQSIGPLALLAWGYQASMRAVRDELMTAAGLPTRPDRSLAEFVLDAWAEQVGSSWQVSGR
jgi:hypothetical protein